MFFGYDLSYFGIVSTLEGKISQTVEDGVGDGSGSRQEIRPYHIAPEIK